MEDLLTGGETRSYTEQRIERLYGRDSSVRREIRRSLDEVDCGGDPWYHSRRLDRRVEEIEDQRRRERQRGDEQDG